MKVTLAFDSFKGCLTSREAAEAAAKGVLAIVSGAEVGIVEMADGGEGMAEALAGAGDMRRYSASVEGPLGEEVLADYYISADGMMASLDMSAASGLVLVDPERRNPWLTSTYGFGQLVAAAARHGVRRIVVGLGGSATNDAALGALQALGARFYDRAGCLMERHICGGMLSSVGSVDLSGLRWLSGVEITAACDVDAPFVGSDGAVAVFSRQKGADAPMMERLETGMVHLADVIRSSTGHDVSAVPGAGAAGGAAGGLTALLGVRLRRGVDIVADAVGLDAALEGCDFCITGEGSADRQTLMWKTPWGVRVRACRRGVPAILLAGRVADRELLLDGGFCDVRCVNDYRLVEEDALPPMSREVAATRIMRATAAATCDFISEKWNGKAINC